MNVFGFDLQRFAVISIGGTSDASTLSSGSSTISASGVQAWVESVSGGFTFGSDSASLTGSILVSGDDTWGATIGTGASLTGVDGISDGADLSIVQMSAGSIKTDESGTYTFNLNEASTSSTFTVNGDSDGVVFNVASGALSSITGLDSGATLQAGATGTYVVNGTSLSVSSTDTKIIGEDGAAHIFNAATDANVDSTDASESISQIEEVVNELVNTEGATTTTVASGQTEVDLSSSTEAVVATINDSGTGNVEVTFNSGGGNVAQVGAGVPETANIAINFGGGDDVAVIGNTGAAVGINGAGNDTLVTSGRNVSFNMSNSKAGTRFSLGLTSKGSKLTLSNFNPLKARAAMASSYSNAAGLIGAITAGLMKLGSSINFKSADGTKSGKISFSGNSSGDLAESSDLAESADTNQVGSYYMPVATSDGSSIMNLAGTYDAGGAFGTSDMGQYADEDWIMVGNYNIDKTGASTLEASTGNDTIFAGAMDIVNAGEGTNVINLANSTSQTLGATVVLDGTNNAKNTINGFRTGFTAGSDILSVGDSIGGYSFDSAGNLIVEVGNNVSTIVSGTGIDSVGVNSLLINVNDDVRKVAVGGTNAVIDASAVAADIYTGANAELNLANVSGDVAILMNQDGAATIGGNTNASVTGISTVRGGSGNTSIYGSSADEVLIAGVGRTSLYGGAGRDTLVGAGTSQDGGTTFGFVTGSGKDLVQNFVGSNQGADASDAIYVDTALNAVSANGSNVVIKLNEDDVMTIEGGVGKDINLLYEGTTYVGQVGSTSLSADGNANYFYATGSNASVIADTTAGAANIWLDNEVSFRSDTAYYQGDIKTLSAKGLASNATLAGNSNDNSIIGGSASNVMWGGNSTSDDTLVAGGSKNAFFYGVSSLNEGNDVITGASSNDTVNILSLSLSDFTEGNASVDVTSSTINVNFANGGSLAVNNNGETFQLGDGSAWVYDKKAGGFQQK